MSLGETLENNNEVIETGEVLDFVVAPVALYIAADSGSGRNSINCANTVRPAFINHHSEAT